MGIKSIEIIDSDSNNTKNCFLKKNSSKSPNLTYLSLDTSQTYEKYSLKIKKNGDYSKKINLKAQLQNPKENLLIMILKVSQKKISTKVTLKRDRKKVEFIHLSNKKWKKEYGSKTKKEDLEFLKGIMIAPRTETKESIKDSDFNTFIQSTENKANERLDFSYIYQQFNHFIYVLGK